MNPSAIMKIMSAKNKFVENHPKFTAFLSAVYSRGIEAGTVGKGDVLSVATTAGIMGVKRTADLIPMCHILPLTNCKIRFEKDPKNLEITCFCTVKVTGKTGVEMEALTGVSVALLTIYDMCKALDKFMEIQDIYLCKKTGGKSGEIVNPRMEDRGEEGR